MPILKDFEGWWRGSNSSEKNCPPHTHTPELTKNDKKWAKRDNNDRRQEYWARQMTRRLDKWQGADRVVRLVGGIVITPDWGMRRYPIGEW